jgi:regulator of protease activity HflC (stomatin/prohibitin superfamily)
LIDLNEPVIRLGPWTLLTIDQGYMAVTQDNGRQVILDGGAVYLLTHRNWKFEKFVSVKIQTNELKRIEAASADNVIMLVDATVLWRISDVETAVRMSAETMAPDGSKAGGDILKLRNDVLKQAEASLAFFIGTINFSDSMAAAAFNQRSKSVQEGYVPAVNVEAVEETKDEHDSTTPMQRIPEQEVFNLYNNERLRDAVTHANEITTSYGVEVISINIISAIPKDEQLQASLAKGAVAAAEAQMMETSAQGKGRAIEIEAAAKAKQTMILAKADADAAVLRAEGAKQAADLLSQNEVSVELAKIERTGEAIAGQGNHASFFFGANADDFSRLLSNGSVIQGASELVTRQHSLV